MNDAILRRELRRIAIENRHRCFGCGSEHSCGIHGCAIILEALERLKLKEANDPLTLEQLQEMDGEPVWCVVHNLPKGGYYCLCDRGVIIAPSGRLFDCKDIPDWTFYRRKPETPADGKEEENT